MDEKRPEVDFVADVTIRDTFASKGSGVEDTTNRSCVHLSSQRTLTDMACFPSQLTAILSKHRSQRLRNKGNPSFPDVGLRLTP